MENFTTKRVAITGGSGFVGSNLIKYLNNKGINQIDIYDKLDTLPEKTHNILGLNINGIYDYKKLLNPVNLKGYDWVIHLGASSATFTKPEDYEKVLEQNFYFTVKLLHEWRKVSEAKWMPKFIFASSASIFGNSNDFTERTTGLTPPHLYGKTKQMCDAAMEEYFSYDGYYSFRFFNVFGSDESHKVARKMASPVTRFLTENPPFTLFRDQQNTVFERDFIWIKDLVDTLFFALANNCPSGLYNLGSGKGTSWEELAQTCARVRGLSEEGLFKYEPLPENLKGQYQAKTIARMNKLRNQLGYRKEFTPLMDAIKQTWLEIQSK